MKINSIKMKICRNLSFFLQNHCLVGDFDDFLRLRACQSSAGVKYVAFRRRPGGVLSAPRRQTLRFVGAPPTGVVIRCRGGSGYAFSAAEGGSSTSPADGCCHPLPRAAVVLFHHKDAGFALAHLEGDFSGAFRPGHSGEDFTRGAVADEADGLQAVSVRMDADEAASSVDAVV